MSDVDLRSLLDVEVSDLKAPPSWPAGPYHGFIEKYEPTVSRQKGTKGLQFFFKVTRADESIPEEMLKDENGVPFDFSKRQLRTTFWLTPDSLFMLGDFIKSLGIDTDGKKLNAVIPETQGKPVLLQLIQKASEDGKRMYNEVQSVAGNPA